MSAKRGKAAPGAAGQKRMRTAKGNAGAATKAATKRRKATKRETPAGSEASKRKRPARRKPPPSLLTRPLGLEGWSHLEPVVLAALASGDPMLLVGSHGTAKSFLLERLARALGLEYRFYNASILNYDDLVGVPIPDESGQALRYISTPTSIWDAEVVFIDELSRCRPDLANKVFPIVHERRVQGIALPKLRYRWAAMNPPPDDDGPDEEDAYLGAEPLDPALADRFAFIVQVPSWADLDDDERMALLLDQFRGEHPFPVGLSDLVAEAERLFAALCQAAPERLSRYFLALAGLRQNSGAPAWSTRRLTMLMRSSLAVQAARLALERAADEDARAEDVDWEGSVWLAVRHGDPTLARRGRIDHAEFLALHRQAWELSGLADDDPWREVLAASDPVERALRAVELPGFGPDELTPLVLDALAAIPTEAERTATGLAFYLALHREGRLHATAFETLANDIRRVIATGKSRHMATTSQASLARQVGALLAESADGDDTEDPVRRARATYARNLLEALLPDGYEGASPDAVQRCFFGLWDRLRLDERLRLDDPPPPEAASQPVAGPAQKEAP